MFMARRTESRRRSGIREWERRGLSEIGERVLKGKFTGWRCSIRARDGSDWR
jgi:hypothetical protein